MTTKVTSWSPSRYEAYSTCPLRFKLERIDKKCPLCFKGKLVGFDDTTCDTCGGKPGEPEAIARGKKIHKHIEDCITGKAKPTPVLVSVKDLIKALTKAFKAGIVRVEHDLVFLPGWVPTGKFAKGAWLRAKADVMHIQPKEIQITDWKTGGVDKKTKLPRAAEKEADAMEIYSMAALAVAPTADAAISALAYVDGLPGKNLVHGDVVRRKDLVKLQKKWDGKIKPMFCDTTFAPRPNGACRWCAFAKSAGGPCPY